MLPQKRITVLFLLLLTAVILALPPGATAHGMVDQSYAPSACPTCWNWINAHMPIGQSFTPTKSSLVAVDVGLENVLVTDQSYDPGFGGGGYNWINFHTPIGQSFTPTMPILGAVDVGIFNDVILDQSNDPGWGVGWNWVQAHQPIGQSFTPTYPQLWRVDLGLENPSAGPVSLTLNIRQGTIAGTIVGTQAFTVPVGGPSFVSVYFTPYPGVTLTPGMTYVLDLVGGGAATVRWYIQNPGGTYPGGTAITDGSAEPGGDYSFKTYGFGDKITMNIHSGAIGGPVVATKTLPIPPMDFPIMMRFDLSSPITVTPGSTYVIELQQSPRSVRWYIVTPGGGYPGGTAITDGTADANGDYLFDTFGAGTTLSVNIRASTIGGAILGSATTTVAVVTLTLVHVDFPSSIALTPGSQYVIEVQQTDAQSMRWYIIIPGGAYPGGTAITSGVVQPDGDYVFQTYASPGPTATSLSINFAPPTVDLGTPPGTGTITATINPAVPGLPISLYYGLTPAGPWTLISTGPTDPMGKYTITWMPPATGTYFFRADFAGSSSYTASTTTSAPNSMVVIPEFSPALVAVTAALALGMFQVLHRRLKKNRT